MPAALKRPTLDELYKRSRDLDHTQVDERLAVMLNAILQLEAQGDCRESGTEAVLIVGYTSEGISRNSGLSNNTEYGARQFPPPPPHPTRPPAGAGTQSTSKPPSMFRSQHTEESYPDLSSMKRELARPIRRRTKLFLTGIKPSSIMTRQYLSKTRRFLTRSADGRTGARTETTRKCSKL